ncbi:MAG: N-acetylmuramoyl-L-alanine amidase [Anaerolineae bacterium]
MGTRLTRGLLVFCAVLSLLLALGGKVAADESHPPSPIFFWSSQGPVAVERTTEITASDTEGTIAEQLVLELLEGPTTSELEEGLTTAIPEGTALAEVVSDPDGTVAVRLEIPMDGLDRLSHESFEIIVNQIGNTLRYLDWRDLRIQVRGPEDRFLPLADFLPEIPSPRKPTATRVTPVVGAQAAQPPSPGQGQPSGTLSGKTVYVSAGHGWEWAYDGRCNCMRWKTQRPAYPSSASYEGPIIEDHNNAEAVNQYLLQYLWNAGATVWPARERDLNPAESVVDHDIPAAGTEYSETGVWSTTSAAGTGYAGTAYRWADTVTGAPTATATWRASLPADGRYAVYAWYRPGSNRAQQARYVVHHAGGDTTVIVDQRKHGDTWHYLGTYGFLQTGKARVTLTNQSNATGQAVIADAIRFGGGTFNDLSGISTEAESAPDKAWWETAAFYYTQKMGMGAAPNDVTARPVYARWEHAGTGDDAVYVSWHTNGYNGSIRGTETYAHNGMGEPRTAGGLELRQAIHSEVVHDIRAGWDANWTDRGQKVANLGELRELWDEDPSARMPGALIEIGFHDNPEDTDALKHPAFNMLVARALYQGIVKYFEQRDGLDLTLLPEPPTDLRVQNVGDGRVRVSWEPSPTDNKGLRGDAPTGYRVYTSSNGIGWSDGRLVTGSTSTILTDLAEDDLIYVRVTAVNGGGESFSTETLAARGGDRTGILLVNGFDRLCNGMLVSEQDPVEGYNRRIFLHQMNRYDYVVQHAEAIPYPFDSASNEAVEAGRVSLGNYRLVDWILGEESYDDETLSDEEQALLRSYLDGGGALFISGSEIGWDLGNLGDSGDKEFFKRYLRANYVGDNSETYEVAPVPGSIFEGLGSFRFDAPGMYRPDYPDRLGVSYGSSEALRYQGGRGGVAAVQYADGCERVVTFGFPFETIRSESRSAVMGRILDFLDECLNVPAETTIDTPADGSAHGTRPAFSGTANDYGGGLARVEVRIGRQSDGQFWAGSTWQSKAVWLTAYGTTSWTYTLPSLEDGSYVLQARACTPAGACDPTPDEVEFILDTVRPPATSLVAPASGVTLKAVAVPLRWELVVQDSGSEIGYDVRVDDRHDTCSESTYTAWVAGSGKHTWGVRVVDRAGNASDWVEDWFSLEQSHFWLPCVLRGFKR